VFVIWMTGSSLLLFGVAAVFLRNQVQSVRRLAQAADDFGKGREVPDFPPEGAFEVRQVARAFNIMRNRIRRQLAQRMEMLAGVSHDLRTPLTRMKLQLAMMGESPEIAGLKADVEEMRKMLEGYLAFARGESAEKVRTIEIGALLRDVIDGARFGNAEIALEVSDGIAVPARPDALKRCIANLVNNAIIHARHVAISARRGGEMVEITVDDDGPGIPPAEREAVFRPFYRADPSRNPETGGTGLGLTIARDVARGHGGDLTIEDAPLGGVRARLRLPA
jgi:two-component system osmolarity sensor histidine kinase EnvZ